MPKEDGRPIFRPAQMLPEGFSYTRQDTHPDSTMEQTPDVPDFLRLGRPNLPPPAGYAQLLADARVDMPWVRRVVRDEELFDKAIPVEDGSPLAERYLQWLKAMAAWLGLPWSDTLVAMPTYLQFRSVSRHNDGRLQPFGDEDYYFVNLQLAGSGRFNIDGPDEVESWHSIVPGDLYVFDQRLEHAWQSDSPGLCKLLSFALPGWAVQDLAKRFPRSAA